MLLIPHSEARHFYLLILIGSNNEYRRADFITTINQFLFPLEKQIFLFWQHFVGFFVLITLIAYFYGLENIWNIFVFNLPSQLHTTLTIWTQKFKKHDATWRQTSEVFTLCIKWPKVLKTLDGQTFGTSFFLDGF